MQKNKTLSKFLSCFSFVQSDQGIKNLDPTKAKLLAGDQPDYAMSDLYNAIARGEYPSWTLYVQVLTNEQAKNLNFNPFDLTKTFSQKTFPLRRVGRITLNENPVNYFAQIEQLAFSPAHMPPGIEASPDKMLQVRFSTIEKNFSSRKFEPLRFQGRLFSYADTHLHRLGANNLLIPVNNPETNSNVKVCTYQRDGPMQTGSNQGRVLFVRKAQSFIYFPSFFRAENKLRVVFICHFFSEL